MNFLCVLELDSGVNSELGGVAGRVVFYLVSYCVGREIKMDLIAAVLAAVLEIGARKFLVRQELSRTHCSDIYRNVAVVIFVVVFVRVCPVLFVALLADKNRVVLVDGNIEVGEVVVAVIELILVCGVPLAFVGGVGVPDARDKHVAASAYSVAKDVFSGGYFHFTRR